MNVNTKIKNFAVGLSCLVATGLVGCTIDPNLNTSPNSPAQTSLTSAQGVLALLVGCQTMSGDYYGSDRSRLGAMWSWQIGAPPGLGRAQPESWMTYTLDPTGPPDDAWKNAYKALRVTTDIMTYAPQAKFASDATANTATQNTIVGIAEFYRAMLLGETAALFGSAPITITGVEAPKFVDQAAVYTEVQRLLDDALAKMTSAGTNSVGFGQDLAFGGDATQWIAPIHTMKARYYMHTHEYAKALSESKLGIMADKGNVMAVYTNTVGETSPWGHWVIVEGNLRAEKSFVDLLKSEAGDTRLTKYFAPNANGHITGYAGHGETVAATALDSESLDPSLASTINLYGTNDASFPIITFEENVLIGAEAAAQTGDVSSAVLAVNVIRAAAGLKPFASSDAAATLAEVLKQKDLELFLQGQSYHDMRRTKTLPEAVPHTATVNGNLRFIYPQSETAANPNVPADNDALVKPLSGY